MEEEKENSQNQDLNTVSNGKKKRVIVSHPYPIKSLPEAVAFVETIYTKLGANEYFDKEDIAKAHNMTYIAIRQILSTCQQYGLLENKHGVGYKPTDLFIAIKHPDNDLDHSQKIAESFQKPYPFAFLIDRFKGHPIPHLLGIQNPLIKELSYKKDIASKVAGLFVDTLRHYSLLDDKDIIRLNAGDPKQHIPTSGGKPNGEGQKDGDGDKNPIPPPPVGVLPILIPMKSTNEKAYLYLPENYKEEDLDRILKFVDALK